MKSKSKNELNIFSVNAISYGVAMILLSMAHIFYPEFEAALFVVSFISVTLAFLFSLACGVSRDTMNQAPLS